MYVSFHCCCNGCYDVFVLQCSCDCCSVHAIVFFFWRSAFRANALGVAVRASSGRVVMIESRRRHWGSAGGRGALLLGAVAGRLVCVSAGQSQQREGAHNKRSGEGQRLVSSSADTLTAPATARLSSPSVLHANVRHVHRWTGAGVGGGTHPSAKAWRSLRADVR